MLWKVEKQFYLSLYDQDIVAVFGISPQGSNDQDRTVCSYVCLQALIGIIACTVYFDQTQTHVYAMTTLWA